MAKRTRTDKYCVEWTYAKQCWTALTNNLDIPPVPTHRIWESDENGGVEKLIGTGPIKPKRVTYKGKTVFD